MCDNNQSIETTFSQLKIGNRFRFLSNQILVVCGKYAQSGNTSYTSKDSDFNIIYEILKDPRIVKGKLCSRNIIAEGMQYSERIKFTGVTLNDEFIPFDYKVIIEK
jgi:hypothetical protein